MYSCFDITTYITFSGKFRKFSIKMCIFCYIYVYQINNWYRGKFKEKFQFGTPYWSMISSLLHLVGLRPRVYYTLTNFRGGWQGPLAPPPSIRQWLEVPSSYIICIILVIVLCRHVLWTLCTIQIQLLVQRLLISEPNIILILLHQQVPELSQVFVLPCLLKSKKLVLTICFPSCPPDRTSHLNYRRI